MDKIYKVIFIFALFILAPLSAHAATLNFSPPSGSYNVGSTFSVNVTVESVGQAMNAVSGVVSFPWDKLEVVSISKQGSILSLWPAEPSFSNSAGTVSFEGIILTLTSAGETPLAPQAESGASGNALGITSATHSDHTKWYVNNTPEFSWKLLEGTLEVRTLIGKSPASNPSVSYIPPISKKKVDELPDGTYYFALQVRTAAGWSVVSRYRVNIDTTPPKPFSITFPHGNSGFAPQPIVFFSAVDNESGISHYDIKIGDNEELPKIAPDTVSNPYLLTPQIGR